ncbi:MAG: hypothetical protein R3E79_32850 [Caldilineaceae bacterium]
MLNKTISSYWSLTFISATIGIILVATFTQNGITAQGRSNCTTADGDTHNTWGQVHAANLAGFAPFRYGQHYPYGYAAVDWIYSRDGLWRQITAARPLQYVYNYYPDGMDNNPDADISHPPDPAHPLPAPDPQDIAAAQAEADKGHIRQEDVPTLATQIKFRRAIAAGCIYHTTRDANGYVLFDNNNDNALDSQPTGAFAFHEHSARGADNRICPGAVPFTLFWFEDNWLARYMSQAYGRPLPGGLSDANRTFIRWNILDGGTGHWAAYNGTALDQLALDGLYELAQGRPQGAWQKWGVIKERMYDREDVARQRYTYHIDEIYHLSLFLVLTSHLMDANVTAAQRHELVQHWVSLRSNLLSLQERQNGKRFSWVTHADRGCGRYMSTEGTATALLALGAGAVHVLEAGVAPLQMANNHYYLRVAEEPGDPVDQYVLSAVKGVAIESQAGFMVYGPYWQYPRGAYTVDFSSVRRQNGDGRSV